MKLDGLSVPLPDGFPYSEDLSEDAIEIRKEYYRILEDNNLDPLLYYPVLRFKEVDDDKKNFMITIFVDAEKK